MYQIGDRIRSAKYVWKEKLGRWVFIITYWHNGNHYRMELWS